MANLVLKRFQCVEDTSEIGGESPYFITWVGDLREGTSSLGLTRKTYWDNNVSKGPGAWPVEDVVSSRLLTVLRNHQEIFTATDANFIGTMKNTFEAEVEKALQTSAGADDDLMKESGSRAARRIQLSGKAEELPIVTFKGGGGQYNVRYAQT